MTEDFLCWQDEKPRYPLSILEKVRRDLPVVLHGVSLSVGSVDPLNRSYLKRLKSLAERIQPEWISDHLCWTGVGGQNLHDLLPLPFNEEAMDWVVERIKVVQDFLQRRILLENVSSYVTFQTDEMKEWEFLSEIAERADCGILLDINNIYVSAFNHGFDPCQYVDAIPTDRIGQFHLAGHTDNGNHLIDTHDHPICDEVWELFRRAVRRFDEVSTLVEWDSDIPSLEDLEESVARAKEIWKEESSERRTNTSERTAVRV